MLTTERKYASLQMRIEQVNMEGYREGLEEMASHWTTTWANIANEVAIQALFQAATMGMATWMTGAVMAARAGRLATIVNGIRNGSTLAGRAANFAGGLMGKATGVAAEKAFVGAACRFTSATGIFALRRLTGDLGTKQTDFSKEHNGDYLKDLGWGYAASVVFAVLGTPGAPVQNTRLLRWVTLELPSIVSKQGLVQNANLLMKIIKGHGVKLELKNVLKEMHDKGMDPMPAIRLCAADNAKQIQAWALAREKELTAAGKRAGQEHDLYSGFAKLGDWLGSKFTGNYNTANYREVMGNYIGAVARQNLWIGVSHAYRDIIQATGAAETLCRWAKGDAGVRGL